MQKNHEIIKKSSSSWVSSKESILLQECFGQIVEFKEHEHSVSYHKTLQQSTNLLNSSSVWSDFLSCRLFEALLFFQGG